MDDPFEDLPAIPLGENENENDEDDDEAGSGDPWPVWCERIALVLGVATVCLLLVGVSAAANLGPRGTTLPGGGSIPNPQVSVVVRLREAAQYVSAFDGLLLLAAAFLIALDGITSGERRGPRSPVGTAAAYLAAVVSVILVLVGAARGIDILAGHIDPNAFLTYSVTYRLGQAMPQVATVLVSAAACWLAFTTLDNADAWWRQTRSRDDD